MGFPVNKTDHESELDGRKALRSKSRGISHEIQTRDNLALDRMICKAGTSSSSMNVVRELIEPCLFA